MSERMAQSCEGHALRKSLNEDYEKQTRVTTFRTELYTSEGEADDEDFYVGIPTYKNVKIGQESSP